MKMMKLQEKKTSPHQKNYNQTVHQKYQIHKLLKDYHQEYLKQQKKAKNPVSWTHYVISLLVGFLRTLLKLLLALLLRLYGALFSLACLFLRICYNQISSLDLNNLKIILITISLITIGTLFLLLQIIIVLILQVTHHFSKIKNLL